MTAIELLESMLDSDYYSINTIKENDLVDYAKGAFNLKLDEDIIDEIITHINFYKEAVKEEEKIKGENYYSQNTYEIFLTNKLEDIEL